MDEPDNTRLPKGRTQPSRQRDRPRRFCDRRSIGALVAGSSTLRTLDGAVVARNFWTRIGVETTPVRYTCLLFAKTD